MLPTNKSYLPDLLITFLSLYLLSLFSFQSAFATFVALVGLSGLEPPTSRLSGVRSNRLSYTPIFHCVSPNREFEGHSKLNNNTS